MGYDILELLNYKYLSIKINDLSNKILSDISWTRGCLFMDIREDTEEGREVLELIKKETISEIGCFLKPSELFSEMVKREDFILDDLSKIIKNINQKKVHIDIDLTSETLGETKEERNSSILKNLNIADKINFVD